MKPLTIKDLYIECKKQIENGNADKVIMISSDDEGNSYHYLWYSFITIEELEEQIDEADIGFIGLDDLNDKIASKEDTIILG